MLTWQAQTLKQSLTSDVNKGCEVPAEEADVLTCRHEGDNSDEQREGACWAPH